MNKIIVILSILISQSIWSQSFHIRDRIDYQNFFLKVYPHLFQQDDIRSFDEFKKMLIEKDQSTVANVQEAYDKLAPYFPQQALQAILKYRYINPNQEVLTEVLTYLFLNKLMILRDANDMASEPNRPQYIFLIKQMTDLQSFDMDYLFKTFEPIFREKAANITSMEDDENFMTAMLETKLVTFPIEKKVPRPYSLSHLGILSGNKVELISKNEVNMERIDWLNERVIFNGGVLDFSQPYMEMPIAPGDSGHPIFQNDPIFQKIRDMILAAKESIFIDIFLFGGTFGGTLSRFLLDQVKSKLEDNPDFKVVLLHDYATNYNMLPEMMPVFSYIKERITSEKEFKDAVFLLQANIQRHPPGIPFGLTNMVPKTPETFKAIEKRSTYFESKIDHSKVIVIDANSKNPAAYFGSKNWTDHSGGYYYDNALYVEGPAATLVQESYVRDIEAALTQDPAEKQWFYFKEEGYDNAHYLSKRKEIINSFKVTRDDVPVKGGDQIRLAEADVDGTIKNVRNILIDMIVHAKKNIYMEQLFLYDKYVVDALIKRKIEKPSLDIRLILDHNGNFGLNGFPNTIFLKELKKHGILIRARETIGVTAKFPDGTEQTYHQENHRKITSIDGKYILAGSSNINPDTLQGSFREFGAQVFSRREAKKFDKDFLTAWNTPQETVDLDIENYQMTLAGKTLSKDVSALINDIAAFLIRAKDKIEKRL